METVGKYVTFALRPDLQLKTRAEVLGSWVSVEFSFRFKSDVHED